MLVLQVSGMMYRGLWHEHDYGNTVWMDKLEGAEGLGCGMYPVQLRMLC